MIYQIAYWSKASYPMSLMALDKLVEESEKNNRQKQITGLLLYGDNTFFQFLEGDYRTIESLYDKITQDERHYRATRIGQWCVNSRIFSQWSMGFIKLPSPNQTEKFTQYQRWGSQQFLEAPLEIRRLLLHYADLAFIEELKTRTI
ncbi:BLUF domain-containing protein [Catenovulum sediminis]|uniref:BLUF domain-containing protein n=1 Tax=Catenovulum sediminis TaxID=1740262 RepID=A0ABV1RKW4_9ALTE|nr:BLUF domain-containing protein [Catenovulum sediminis]